MVDAVDVQNGWSMFKKDGRCSKWVKVKKRVVEIQKG